ncbi:Dual-specificity kinase, spindle pole body (SPB) duplication and spindle checkpoint function [Maudiozyma exigua]|uniref:Dual-specificity kinase, spindle pole body (SPB) duplication and spindle checkpoint function n=1 Tax=Maudiozyma exigua TaxID=34358 RepID=A0A9P6WDC8_MAUEX|nr:Dual-specificity kinase, spindle pole body (SPB) duplication and spindle checkpoint function [Kazachstania exigua]
MSKYKHHSRSRKQGDGDTAGSSISIGSSSDFEEEDNIGPPKLSNFGSALLAKNNDTGRNSLLSRLQMAETMTNPIDVQSRSQTIYSQTQESPQSSLFAMNLQRTNTIHDNGFTNNNRPISTTTVQQDHDETMNKDSNFSPNNKLKSMQQHMKEELTSRYTERRINRLLLSSNRMNKLGPAKRASSLQNLEMNEKYPTMMNSNNNTLDNGKNVHNLTTKSLSGSLSTNKPIISPNNTEAVPQNDPLYDYSKIDFGELNPLQYLKKKNLPSSELPHISKIYFEKRKEEIRRAALRKYSSSKEVLLNKTKIEKPETIVTNNQENINKEPKINSFEAVSNKPRKREALSNVSINKKEPEHKKTKKVEIQEPIKTNTYRRNNSIKVNDIEYERMEMLGRGGSSKVYKVKGPGNKVYALKRVIFDEFDETSVNGFKGEIELLQKLDKMDRVVHLYDYMMDQGLLYLIMECGDFDLSQILQTRMTEAFDSSFIRYYIKEMIECIKIVHDSDIVHSDLKPANFVVVKGKLKIIDFGIANAVPDHTVNIYRDTQIGTPNYMAPEALVAMSEQQQQSNKKNTWKVGKPSDIWSCGCIIYQMVYGKPPYANYQGQSRLLAIMNPDVRIIFPERSNDIEKTLIPKTLIELMKQCLIRDPDKRLTVDEILNCSYLKPVIVTEFFIKDLIKNAVIFGSKQKNVSDDKIEELTNDVLNRLDEFKM